MTLKDGRPNLYFLGGRGMGRGVLRKMAGRWSSAVEGGGGGG